MHFHTSFLRQIKNKDEQYIDFASKKGLFLDFIMIRRYRASYTTLTKNFRPSDEKIF